MVCAECNGKGYRIGKNGEEVCPECGGKGEQFPGRARRSGEAAPPLRPWGCKQAA
jgi:DnaJ-class molecular chaperone